MPRQSTKTARVCLNCQCKKTFYRAPSLPFRYCSHDCFVASRVRPVAERFWEKVDRRGPDDCWLWQGALDGHGYGHLSSGKGRALVRAHRLSYELEFGPIPDGLLIRHGCPHTNCVNPRHLTTGDYTANLLDRYRAGRAMIQPEARAKQANGRVERPCLYCGVFFTTTQPLIDQGKGKYCSPAHAAAFRYGASEVDRFWAKVDKSGECWLWTGARHEYGYGLTTYQGIQTGAHRAAWKIVNGPIPEGLLVCHNCPGEDNPLCVRPDHMFLGTHKQNMQDCARKGKTTTGDKHFLRRHPEARQRGEQVPGAKLTPALVQEIRTRAAGGETQQSIAADKGITQSNAGYIVRRKTWQHVP